MFSRRNNRGKAAAAVDKEAKELDAVAPPAVPHVEEEEIVGQLRARIAELEEQLEISEMNRMILKDNFALENEAKLKLMEEVAALKLQLAFYTSPEQSAEPAQPTGECAGEEGEVLIESTPDVKSEDVQEELQKEEPPKQEETGTDRTENNPEGSPPVDQMTEQNFVDHQPPLEESEPPVEAVQAPLEESEQPVHTVLSPREESEDTKHIEETKDEPPVTRVDEEAQTDAKLTVRNHLGEELSVQEAEALIEAQRSEILALTKELAAAMSWSKKSEDESGSTSTAPRREIVKPVAPPTPPAGSGCCLVLFGSRRVQARPNILS